MDPKDVQAAIEALKNGDAQGALDLLEKILIAAAGGTPSDDSDSDPLAADPEAPPVKVAALSAVRTLTGCANLGEAVVLLNAWKADRDIAASNAAALEESSRGVLVGELVKLGVELPATAWTGEGAARKLAKRLADEPIAELRTRVVALRSTRAAPASPTPPVSGSGSVASVGSGVVPVVSDGSKLVTLSDGRTATVSAFELSECKKRNISPEDFAARKLAAVKRI